MPENTKVGTQLLISPELRDRARALAIVRQESVAEVWRAALEGPGIPTLETRHAEALEELERKLAGRAVTLSRSDALVKMLTSRHQETVHKFV